MLKFIQTYYTKAKQNIPWLKELGMPKLLNYLCTILGFLCVGFALLSKELENVKNRVDNLINI